MKGVIKMGRDEYGHYINDEGVEIRISTDKNGKDHIDIYDSCPAENPDHSSIHINIDTDTGKGKIVDTTSGEKEETDTQCYLTTACMKFFQDRFDDDCYELNVLRRFRDNFVSKEDIAHYYSVAPIIVETINNDEKQDVIYDYIYDNVVEYCVKQIEQGNYDAAYNRYKNSVLVLEEQFVRPKLGSRLVKVLRLINGNL